MIPMRGARGLIAFLILLASGTRSTQAQSVCLPQPAAQRSWPVPLDRTVTLHSRNLSLRDALDRMAASARLRFSYSAELLPLERRVCASFVSVPVGDVLVALLRGLPVEAVGAGGDHVVLTPALVPDAAHANRPRPTVIPLEGIVVTGQAAEVQQQTSAFASDIISGALLDRQNISTMADALATTAPGLWLWQQSPSTLLAQYGSVRGASSFGLSHPKMYLDGIEVANPLVMTRLAAQTIERIETIRGPQGAALHGADAISGVINIVTRDQIAAGAEHGIELQSQGGFASSSFAVEPVLTQEHTLGVRVGSNQRSAGLTLTGSTLDAFVPGAFTRQLALQSRARAVGQRGSLSATLRYSAQQAGAATSPLLVAAGPAIDSYMTDQFRNVRRNAYDAQGAITSMYPLASDSGKPQSIRHLTTGLTARVQTGAHWTHSLVAGLDAYQLEAADAGGYQPAPAPFQLEREGAQRASLRFSSQARFGSVRGLSTQLTLGAEHSRLQQQTRVRNDALRITQAVRPDTGAITNRLWQSNTGVLAQANTAWRNAFFVNGGLRLEHNGSGFGRDVFTVLPMLGTAWVHEAPGVSIKVRSAYGRGMRPAATTIRDLRGPRAYPPLAGRALKPEQQAGIETGVDLLVGGRVSLHVTRFDQNATGLIQQVAMDTLPAQTGRKASVILQPQNVGEISNRGWEFQAGYQHAALNVAASMALVDSRVQHVDQAYHGDLRAGDRMPGVPRVTASVTTSYSGQGWFTALTATRAANWVGYDRLAMARDYASIDQPIQRLMGPALRTYWRNYNGVTRLRATASHDLTRGIVLSITGENLLNYQRGEPDDITVLPGRTITLGVRARF